MSSIFITREGPIAAADTVTPITTLGSRATPGTVFVPNNARRLDSLILATGQETPAGTDGGGVLFVRISGGGIEGEQIIMVGGQTEQMTTQGDCSSLGTIEVLEDLHIDVKGNEAITVDGEYAGIEAMDNGLGVTYGFE